MKNIYYIFYGIAFCFLPCFLQAQNNGIFNGGEGVGWSRANTEIQLHNNIFIGGENDGYDNELHGQKINSFVFLGGRNDGYSYGRFETRTGNDIFAGRSDDGYDQLSSSTVDANGIFSGGRDDGYFNELYSQNLNSFVFDGGGNDGYSVSKISKLIWTGEESDDWLMAGNWNIARTPDQNDYVFIPGGANIYPNLSDHLLIGYSEPSSAIYRCRSIEVFRGAFLYGNDQSWFDNYQLFLIKGTVHFQKNIQRRNTNHGLIEIFENGLMRMGQ